MLKGIRPIHVQIITFVALLLAGKEIYEVHDSFHGPLSGLGFVLYTLPSFIVLILSILNGIIGFKRYYYAVFLVVLSIGFILYCFVLTLDDPDASMYFSGPTRMMIANSLIFNFSRDFKKNQS